MRVSVVDKRKPLRIVWFKPDIMSITSRGIVLYEYTVFEVELQSDLILLLYRIQGVDVKRSEGINTLCYQGFTWYSQLFGYLFVFNDLQVLMWDS